MTKMTQNHWWTGATDLGREGHWYWAGSLATVGDFLWYKPTNQPNGGIAHNCMFWKTVGVMNFMAMIMAVQIIPVFSFVRKNESLISRKTPFTNTLQNEQFAYTIKRTKKYINKTQY